MGNIQDEGAIDVGRSRPLRPLQLAGAVVQELDHVDVAVVGLLAPGLNEVGLGLQGDLAAEMWQRLSHLPEVPNALAA